MKDKYLFECGCRGFKTVRVRNEKGSKILSCPKHKKPSVGKIKKCHNCKKEIVCHIRCHNIVYCDDCRAIRRRKQNLSVYKRGEGIYSTKREVAFIKSLKPSTAAKYYEGLQLRSNWKYLNRDVVLAACRKQAQLAA